MQVQSAINNDSLGDILERVLDKGVVIAGDVSVSLVGIELLTIRLRLLIASVDKAKEMGINWWEADPALSADQNRLLQENRDLRRRLAELDTTAADIATAGNLQETV